MMTVMRKTRFVPYFLAVACVLGTLSPVRGGSSNSLLDLTPDGRLLLVANPDNGTVSVVDTAARKVVSEIPVGDKPEGVTWIGNGPLAAVTVYREDLVVFLDSRAGQVLKKLPVADEPYGIVAAKDGRRAWVSHDYPGSISEIDLGERKIVRALKVAPYLRGLCLSPEGDAGPARLYATQFHAAALYAVDLRSGTVVDSWKGQSTDNLCRHVVVHPRRPKAYLTHLRSKIHVADGSGSIFPELSICDLVDARKPAASAAPPRRRITIDLDTYNNVSVVTNPWEAALSPDGKRLYTIYAGTNDMNVSEVLDDDYQEIERIGSKVSLGQNPRAVRVSPDGKWVYVYNALDFAVSVHDARTLARAAEIKVCDAPKSPAWVRGKVLFSTALPPLTSRRWIACASCHPDGQSDGRVWQNPEGLRKTPSLFGLAHTHPLHWSADRDEVHDFEYTIRGRLMQGAGLARGPLKPKIGFHPIELEEKLGGRSADLDALAVYCNSFAFTRSPHIPAPGQLAPAAERGKTLFFSKEAGCASCHAGPYYSDSRLQKPFLLHDVGTGADDPSEKMGPRYDTPTLLGVYRSAPYLHHGKAQTLRDVLTIYNKEDRHGKTSHLRLNDIDDLVEFLKSLPYETPPEETPNAVQERVRQK